MFSCICASMATTMKQCWDCRHEVKQPALEVAKAMRPRLARPTMNVQQEPYSSTAPFWKHALKCGWREHPRLESEQTSVMWIHPLSGSTDALSVEGRHNLELWMKMGSGTARIAGKPSCAGMTKLMLLPW